jgi:hypothetical protein
MNNNQATISKREPLKPAAETRHLKALLQSQELAWLQKLKEAQAKAQCRQL